MSIVRRWDRAEDAEARRGATLRVGTDVQAVDEIRESLARFGARYAERIYTAGELAAAGGLDGSDPAPGLAARFAAKEATIKVLRPTVARPAWRSIEVVRREGGWCELALTGAAAQLARAQGVVELALSMSHGAGVGIASVVARLDPREGASDDRD
jgi:holo-[acyl-carrier protein] synthase